VNILKDGYFWPIYCAEVDKNNKDGIHAYAFPMVCFCDIPLSQITEHAIDYGHYAIAMSKDWAKKKGVSPVTYYYGTESLVIRLLMRNQKIISKKDKMLWLSILKKYRGKTWSWGKDGRGGYRNKILYNEREWRYIPQSIPYNDLFLEVEYEKFHGSQVSEKTRKYGLNFTFDDVRYIIISEENERVLLLDKLKETIPDDSTRKILSSKILTFEQTKDDF
jgi:hypothetical protein